MVEKLFYTDAYIINAEAKVLRIDGNKVVLDRTIFFAFSGGQQSDSGTINGIPVIEVEKDGETIVHTLATGPDFREGEHVKLILDWQKRHTIMKLHSAAHLVYELLPHELKQKPLIGSNISVDKARLDFEFPEPVSKFLPELEAKVNHFLSQNYDIITKDDPDEPGRRLWICAEFQMPCGGTHVKSTAEIGKINLKRKNLGKSKERVEITLG